jgi:GntR family histidine utilization transcriptional repressor
VRDGDETPPTGWRAVQVEILRRINARDWAPGERIPREVELAAEFGVARATMSRALRELAESGVLDRRRKGGTRVALRPARRATLRIPVIRSEVEAAGKRYAHRLLAREAAEPPAATRARLGAASGDPFLRLETLHLADGAPHALETRWIALAAVPAAADADFAAVSANEWLVANAPFTGGEAALSAEAATGEEADRLGLAEGAPVLVLERATWDGPRGVTLARLVHAPGRRLTMRL